MDGDKFMEDVPDGGEGEDDSDDDDDVDDDIQQMALKVTNKTDDSGFWSGIKDSSKIEALMGTDVQWTRAVPRYQVGMSAGSSSLQSSHLAGRVSINDMVSGTSFDEYMQRDHSQIGHWSWNSCGNWPMNSWT